MNKEYNYIYIVSLGCAKNFVDTEVMAASLVTSNTLITPYADEANIFLINSCAFIKSARDETTEVINDAIEWKNGVDFERHIIVSGCINQWDTDNEFRKNFTDVDLWVGIDEAKNIGAIVNDLVGHKNIATDSRIVTTNPQFLYDESTPRLQLTAPHYAYLKISDGCINNCTYCSIPLIRGKLRSRSVYSVIEEAKNLINNGVQELLLIGQDLTAFGNDIDNDEDLAILLVKLDKIEGDFSIRILYNHPAHLTKEILDIMADSQHILHYFDIPLQHISDNILEKMNRKVNRKSIEELLNYARKVMPDVAIRTTFIVGFPGETEDNFIELRDFIQEQKFTRMGVFAYCEEPHTKAINFDKKVPANIALERCDELMQMQAQISFDHNESCIGDEFTVVVDSLDIENKEAICRSYMDAPEVDNVIIVNLDNCNKKIMNDLQIGSCISVEIDDCETYELYGHIV